MTGRNVRAQRLDRHPVAPRTRRTIVAIVLGVLLAACAAPPAPAPAPTTPAPAPTTAATCAPGCAWATLSRDVDPVLVRLAEPIAACIRRHDTDHPAFHGCVDWHSAVHATYALLAIGRLTGDPRYAALALQESGAPDALAREVDAVRTGALAEEEPYGLAWALVLAAEARGDGVDRFAPLGRAAADALEHYLTGLGPDDLVAAAAEPEYGNALWAVTALARWGRVTGDAQATAVARTAADAVLGDPADRCAAELQAPATGFLSPCALAVTAAAELGDPADRTAGALPLLRRLRPLDRAAMPSVHSAGLNFARAWGAFAAARGAPDLCDVGATLVTAHLALEDRWRTGYFQYAHWVAQFGVFAVDEAVRSCPAER